MPKLDNNLIFRSATTNDTQFIWQCRKETKIGIETKTSCEETYESHKLWMSNFLEDTDRIFLIVEYNGSRIGYIRFSLKKENKGNEISIYLLPEFRKMGIGKTLLEKACNFAREKGRMPIYAEIHNDNAASKKLFCSYGFRLISANDDKFSTYIYD